jgi:hypothetical protein
MPIVKYGDMKFVLSAKNHGRRIMALLSYFGNRTNVDALLPSLDYLLLAHLRAD